MTMNVRDDFHPIALRARRCWLALASDPCRTLVVPPCLNGRLCFSVALRVPRSVSVVKVACLPRIVNPRPDTVSDMASGSGAPSPSRCVNPVGHVLAAYRGTVLEQVSTP